MLFAALAWLLTVAQASAPAVPAAPVPALQVAPDRATRLLVIAPHPDDEALGAAGLIQRVREAGGTVRVVRGVRLQADQRCSRQG